ncbi:hypothetical protein H4W31_002875 [Plantactinospora soyae]|uniref:Uncharacterized protein n=1 Tax=Plantactinospora soyae TaxID=1544732 RepID=A0A927M383_9ACTN|nr:hypothetical protein [Plantactinospora soyae]
MSTGAGPVIGHLAPGSGEPRRGGLVDVLVGEADHRSAADRCADLFGRYPGLTLVLFLDAGGPAAQPAGGQRLAGQRLGGPGGCAGTAFDGGMRLTAGLRDGLLLRLRSGRPGRCAPVRIGEVARWLYLRWSVGVDLTGSAGRELADTAGIRLSARVDRWSDQIRRPVPPEVPDRLVELAAEAERP